MNSSSIGDNLLDIAKSEADEIDMVDIASRDTQFQMLVTFIGDNLDILAPFTVENWSCLITVSLTCHLLLQL